MATAILKREHLHKLTLNELGLLAKEHLMFRMPFDEHELQAAHPVTLQAAWDQACAALGPQANDIMSQIDDPDVQRRLMADALKRRPRQS